MKVGDLCVFKIRVVDAPLEVLLVTGKEYRHKEFINNTAPCQRWWIWFSDGTGGWESDYYHFSWWHRHYSPSYTVKEK